MVKLTFVLLVLVPEPDILGIEKEVSAIIPPLPPTFPNLQSSHIYNTLCKLGNKGGEVKFELLWYNTTWTKPSAKIYCNVSDYNYILICGCQDYSYTYPPSTLSTNWYEGTRILFKADPSNYNKGGAGVGNNMFFAYTDWAPVTLEADGISGLSSNRPAIGAIYGLKCKDEIL